MNVDQEVLHQAAKLIREADSIIITAGAGMSVDSGLPDFRGKDGFWKAYPALKEADIDFYSIASPHTFKYDPRLAWGFYGHRLNLYRNTTPHQGFQILLDWANSKTNGYFVFTSNVDGHFQKAGFNPNQVVECHGSINHVQCFEGCLPDIWEAKFTPVIDNHNCRLTSAIPNCQNCNSIARPNILMFFDGDWFGSRTDSAFKQMSQWMKGIENPVVIEIGAGNDISTVRHHSELITRQMGNLIRINPREFEVPRDSDIGISLGGLDALQRINALLKGGIQ